MSLMNDTGELALCGKHMVAGLSGLLIFLGIYWLACLLYLRRSTLRDCVPGRLIGASGRLLLLFLVLTALSCLGMWRVYVREGGVLHGWVFIGGMLLIPVPVWVFCWHARYQGYVVLSALPTRLFHGEASARDALIRQQGRAHPEPEVAVLRLCCIYLVPVHSLLFSFLLAFMSLEMSNWREFAVEQARLRGQADAARDYISAEKGITPETERPEVSPNLGNTRPIERLFRTEERLSLTSWMSGHADTLMEDAYQESYSAAFQRLRSRQDVDIRKQTGEAPG